MNTRKNFNLSLWEMAIEKEYNDREKERLDTFKASLKALRSYFILDEMRGFRHIFRHSYDYELSQSKVENLKNRVIIGWDKIFTDLQIFEDFLKACIK